MRLEHAQTGKGRGMVRLPVLARMAQGSRVRESPANKKPRDALRGVEGPICGAIRYGQVRPTSRKR